MRVARWALDVPFSPGFWDTHPHRNNFSGFYLELFGILSREMGLESPFREPADLWFDYPKIRDGQNAARILSDVIANRAGGPEFEFLVVNSVPLSGQLRAFRGDPHHLTPLIEELAAKYRVIVTNPVERPAGTTSAPPDLVYAGLWPVPDRHRHALTALSVSSDGFHRAELDDF